MLWEEANFDRSPLIKGDCTQVIPFFIYFSGAFAVLDGILSDFQLGICNGSHENKTISDGGITVDFWFIKIHTSN